jgi:hypothetical protein
VQMSSSAAASAAPTSTPAAAPAPLTIVAIETPTDTGTLLTFSKPLQSASFISQGNFQITDTGGTALTVVSSEQLDPLHVLLVTAKQAPATTYVLRILAPITAQDGGTTPPALQREFLSLTAAAAPASLPSTVIPIRPYGRNPVLPIPQSSATRGTRLPGSGVGLIGIFIAAGAAAGRTMRRKNRKP